MSQVASGIGDTHTMARCGLYLTLSLAQQRWFQLCVFVCACVCVFVFVRVCVVHLSERVQDELTCVFAIPFLASMLPERAKEAQFVFRCVRRWARRHGVQLQGGKMHSVYLQVKEFVRQRSGPINNN